MKVEFSKAFIKASKRLSGKMLDSLKRTIVEVKAAKGIQDISDCKKLVGYRNIYRIRLGYCITYLQQGDSSPHNRIEEDIAKTSTIQKKRGDYTIASLILSTM